MLTIPMFMGGRVAKIEPPDIKRTDFTPSDLTELFATEINRYYKKNVWNLVTDINNVDNVVVGDWVPIEVSNYTYDMEIACINCYEGECYDNDNPVDDGSGDGAVTKIPSHIDLISKQLYNISYEWNTGSNGYNNGSSNQWCPWLHSTMYTHVNRVVSGLPQELQDVIIEKCMLIEQRYSSGSSSLTEATGECWQPIGKLWLPNEIEIFGDISYSSKTYGAYGTQYETLNTATKRTKHRPSTSSNNLWASLSPYSGNNTNIVSVSNSGSRGNVYASNDGCYFPICCRIELK